MRVFKRKLSPFNQTIIIETAKEMGEGMAEYVKNGIIELDNLEQYNSYTRFVAGILGEGLTKMFIYSGLESILLTNLIIIMII